MAFSNLSISPSLSFSCSKKLITKPKFRRSHLVFASIRNLSEAECIVIKEKGELDGRIPVGAGVYGVYDSNGDLQFIGTSRSISTSINKHRRWVPQLCSSVKVGPLETPNPETSELKSAWEDWIKEHISKTGKIPPGNTPETNSWLFPPPKIRLPNPTQPIQPQIHKILNEHKTVVFIHGLGNNVRKTHDYEYAASTRLVGELVKHGADFVTVDLLDQDGKVGLGLRRVLEEGFRVYEIPQVFVDGVLVGGEEFVMDLVERAEIHTLF